MCLCQQGSLRQYNDHVVIDQCAGKCHAGLKIFYGNGSHDNSSSDLYSTRCFSQAPGFVYIIDVLCQLSYSLTIVFSKKKNFPTSFQK